MTSQVVHWSLECTKVNLILQGFKGDINTQKYIDGRVQYYPKSPYFVYALRIVLHTVHSPIEICTMCKE